MAGQLLGGPPRATAQLSLLPTGSSQESEADSSSEQPEAPPPVSLADIPVERRAFVARQRQIERGLAAAAGTIAAFETELEALGERITRLLGPSGRPLAERSVNELLDLEAALRGDLADSERLVAELDGEVRQLEGILDELDTLASRWQKLEAVAVERGAPEAIVESARSTAAEVDELASRTRGRRNELLEQLESMTRVDTTLDTLQAETGRRRQEAQTQIVDARTQPIWQLSLVPSAYWEALGSRVRRDLASVIDYVSRYRYRLLIALLLLLAGCAWLWPRLRQAAPPADDHRGPSARRPLRHPLAASALLVLMGLGTLATGAPRPFYDLLSLFSVVPAAILVAATFGRRARPLIVAVAVARILSSLDRYVAISPLLDRSVLLVQSLGLASVLVWQLRQSGWEDTLPNPRVRRLARASAWLAVLLLAVTVLGVIFGLVSLARYLGDAVISILGATLVLLALTYLLYGVGQLLLGVWPLRGLRVVRRHRERVERFWRRLLVVGGSFLWTLATLSAFGVLDRVPAALDRTMALSVTLGSLTITLGNVVTFVLVVALALLLARLVTFLLDEQFLPALPLERGLPWAISTAVRYAILLAGFALAAMAAGLDLTHATILVGAFSVGLGFGLQNVVNNFFSGLILMFERPIKIGDMVEIGSLAGHVTEIGIRSSTVKTFQGAEVIVPNAELISKEVVNWTLSNRFRRVEIPVGVAYGSDVEQVMALLLETVQGHEQVTPEPAPQVLFTGFGDSSLDFELRCWVTDVDHTLIVSTDLRVAVERTLREHDVEIPFPQRDVHVIAEGEEAESEERAKSAVEPDSSVTEDPR